MARSRDNHVSIEDFPGEINNVDKASIPLGAAQTQINLTSRIIGQLSVRRGYRRVEFEDTTLVTSLAAD